MEILDGVKDRYESFHKVRYRPEALRTAIYQSSRYIPDRHLPDKAIDVIDEAGARVKLRRVRDTQNLRRLEQATGLDVAGAIVDFIASQVAFPELDVRQKLSVSTAYGVAELLVVFRERQGDGSGKHDYLLSNAPLTTPLPEFAALTFSPRTPDPVLPETPAWPNTPNPPSASALNPRTP